MFESRFPLKTPRIAARRFCYALAGWPFPACCVQTSFVQENILRPAFSCTSLTDLADCRPDSERLEQKTPEGSVFRCTNEICTSQYQLHRTFSPGRDRPWCRWGRETGIVSSGDWARSVTVLRSDLYNFIVGGDAIPGTGTRTWDSRSATARRKGSVWSMSIWTDYTGRRPCLPPGNGLWNAARTGQGRRPARAKRWRCPPASSGPEPAYPDAFPGIIVEKGYPSEAGSTR